ncbi:unnamed protein product [Mesocestoides corti]|uniref:Inositol-pentakisphosphate 2-kinase n=2 Tax=Mesocestoides corti TaxID=53468 RepID=A0A158QVW4_MESCO|nr:unnamed protein product [Mesocestoides corti]
MINPNDLVYRGEGNNNIILADNKGLIYRVRKTSLPAVLPTKKTRAFKKSHQITVLFGQHRMAQYFGPGFVHHFESIYVDSSTLKAIKDRFQPSRPAFRLDRDVDVQTNRVLACPDATILPSHLVAYGKGPVLCVEIKPKFGAIPRGPERDPVEMATRRNAMFCIMQFHETKMRMWGRRSSYCPCDLFSGTPGRMVRALEAMLEVRQNNLRVFLNSRCVLNNRIDHLDDALADFFYCDQGDTATAECSTNTGVEANYYSSGDSVDCTPPLLSSGPEESSSDDSESYPNETCRIHLPRPIPLRHRLITDLILAGLLSESPSSASSVIKRSPHFRYDCDLHPHLPSPVLQDTSSSSSYVPSSVSRCCDLPLNSALGRILNAQLESSLSHQDMIEHYKRVAAYFEEHDISWTSYIAGKVTVNVEETPSDLVRSLELVEKHLVAMVARDCSVMLTFQRAKSDCPEGVLTVGGDCPCVPKTILNISIVDLDPKQLSNLEERVESERRVVEQFLVEQEKK